METTLSQQLQRFIPFDEWSEDIIDGLLPHFRIYILDKGKVVFKRGDADEECHFLLKGTMDLADEHFNVTNVDAEDDDNFMALDSTHHIHRYAGITTSECEFVSVKRAHLDLISTWAELRTDIRQSGDTEDDESDWLERLVTSELFNRIPAGNIQKLLSRFEEVPVKLGDEIIRQGEPGEHCYVIKHGRALVTRSDGENIQTLAALTHGNLFGEDALVSSLPRNATITMSSDGVLMRLAKEHFDALLRQPVVTFITAKQIEKLVEEGDTGTVVLDVRHEEEYAADPMLRARNIPLAKLRDRLKELEPAFIYIVAGGNRAEAAAYILSEAGFDARVLKEPQ
ncbi:cyclic nucleotide-binding domain-containing protein [Thalassolituus oleivorans]|jgi:CRP-like cAMP-binding protein|uniref:cAMP-dependent protein kinase regulatory chain n=2 Tax=Thalassolituus oleivorans TaxID=187493 RepID=M5E0E2_9GAMM|nr:cyclic nucleotide-binding domain-containing protein [Thalassolituus oleivorans]PCI49875.1 MAG: calcium-binding protein [Oceanospirillales bacterium]PHQ87292.1 MAG: calcium-binding protein [Thalassobium sp.]AHK16551.1 calcium-binding protein [Thalassolituus oleivorans R6-15]APR67983.1 hypothetical protein CN03_14215 [Thalassolituus oleivorans]MBQ0726387.1 cyclic nucleotide-binding domain-containing protein [Thalassolituus oleivorans]|tara:strand:+ start:1130 stop:2149 length:1020 start_codon:yes stop_codon:yes gene_type:complete